MSEFVALLITGAVSGGIYAILAAGLVISYVTSGIFNFAYGAIAFSVAYFYYQVHTGLGVPLVPAAVLALFFFAPLIGLALDRLVFRHLVTATPVAKIVAPIGILVALPNLMLLVSDWLANTAHVPLASRNLVFLPPGLGPYPAASWRFLGSATLNSNQLAVFAAALFVSIGLWFLIKRTTFGLRMRAVVDRRNLASLRGINPERVSTQGVVLSSVLAGLSGILIAPLFNLDPGLFTLLMFVSAAGAVFGRFRSIPLAMVGGLVMGVASSLVAGYINISSSLVPGLTASVPFVLLLLALFFLGRERGRVAGQVAEDEPPPDYLADLPKWRRALPWVVLTVVLVVWIQTTSTFNAGLAAQGIGLGIVFLSFVVITGAGGLVSLAQAAFVSIGAMMAALAIAHGVPFFAAAVVGAVAACALGLLVALPSLRLGGLALALATLAAGFMADRMVFQIAAVTGGSSGRPLLPPVLGPFNFLEPASYAMLLLVLFGIIALGVKNLFRSSTGRQMLAIRSSEVAAATSGASPLVPRLVLFGVSAAIAGFGGALLAANHLRISPQDFTTTTSLLWVAVMVVFGVRRIGGALVAGLLVYLFPEVIRHATDTSLLPPILFGLGAITLAQQPDGFMAVIGLSRQANRAGRRAKRIQTTEPAAPVETAGPIPETTPVVPVLATEHGRPASNGERTEYALELRGISAGYEGIVVLHDLDLVVPKGTFVAIIGPNGAGKSTLCSVAAGLLPPLSGSVHLDGEEVTGLPAYERARRGLLLAPEYRGIFPGLSVEENVAVWIHEGAGRRGALQRFPILDQRRRLAAELLSGGEQQMLTMATALERPPELLILDEPSLGLSPIASGQVFDTLAELHSRGTTVVVVEEQARRAAALADTIMLLDLGRVKWQGPADEFTEEQARELYLGVTRRH